MPAVIEDARQSSQPMSDTVRRIGESMSGGEEVLIAEDITAGGNEKARRSFENIRCVNVRNVRGWDGSGLPK